MSIKEIHDPTVLSSKDEILILNKCDYDALVALCEKLIRENSCYDVEIKRNDCGALEFKNEYYCLQYCSDQEMCRIKFNGYYREIINFVDSIYSVIENNKDIFSKLFYAQSYCIEDN